MFTNLKKTESDPPKSAKSYTYAYCRLCNSIHVTPTRAKFCPVCGTGDIKKNDNVKLVARLMTTEEHELWLKTVGEA